jgi:nucleotide-binding universal stress UspA family protein
MIRRILVGLGGTPFSETATQRAVELAKAHGARLSAATLFDPATLDVGALYSTSVVRAAVDLREERIRALELGLEEAMDFFGASCRAADIPFRIHWESCDPFDEVVSLARYHDLFICGLRGLFDYGIDTDPEASLIRLIRHGVHPTLAVSRSHERIERVLIAYSGSVDSARALKTYVQSGLWPDADICIACFDRKEARRERLAYEAVGYCEAHGRRSVVHHADAPPEKGILDKAESWDADLLVLGDGAHNVIVRKVLGDTLLEVVRQADRPLLLTH